MDLISAKKGIISKVMNSDNFSIEEFVSKVQGFCLGLRLTHWETKSYATHKAVEMIQACLEEDLDTFVEAFLGYVGKEPTFNGIVTKSTDVDAMINYLNSIGCKDEAILDIRNSMVADCYKLKYLRELK